MKTINELMYYCEEPEPVGAVLLTGEWGCGKTYLIDNELKEALKDKAPCNSHFIVWYNNHRRNTYGN